MREGGGDECVCVCVTSLVTYAYNLVRSVRVGRRGSPIALVTNYSTANPHVSSTACVSLSYINWYDS